MFSQYWVIMSCFSYSSVAKIAASYCSKGQRRSVWLEAGIQGGCSKQILDNDSQGFSLQANDAEPPKNFKQGRKTIRFKFKKTTPIWKTAGNGGRGNVKNTYTESNSEATVLIKQCMPAWVNSGGREVDSKHKIQNK